MKTIRFKQTTLGMAAMAVVAAGLLTACNTSQQSQDEQIRKQAAEDTKQVRHDAKAAGAEARTALNQAKEETTAAVAGIRDGLKDDSSSSPKIDINAASATKLEALPGVSAAAAHKIIHNRPYTGTDTLVSDGTLSQAQYDRISSRIVAH